MMNRKNLRIALTMIVLVLGGGCSGGDDNGSVGGSSNPPPNSPPPSNPAFSQDVPKTGGTVETPDGVVKLDFPQDALDGTTTITVNHLDGSAPPNGLPVSSLNLGDESVQDVVQFGPDGLDFAKPVRLTLRYDPAKLPSGTTPEMIVISKMREDGLLQLARNIQVDVVNHTVSGDISGFSTYVSAIDPRPPAACGYADETLNEDLLADNVTATSVTVSWTTTRPEPGCTGDPIVEFWVERAPAEIPNQPAPGQSREPREGDFVRVAIVPNGPLYQTPAGRFISTTRAQPGTSYRYRIIGRSFRQHLWLPVTSILVTTPPGSVTSAPPAPDRFAAAWDDPYAVEFFYSHAVNSSTPRVRLNWTPVPDAEYYRLLRREANELLYSEIRQVHGAVTAYDDNVTADGHYFYRVTSVNSAGESTFLEQEIVPLGSHFGDPAFHICVDPSNAAFPSQCFSPPEPYYLAPGSSGTIRFSVVMIPVFVDSTSVVNPNSCEIRFALFNASSGVLSAQVDPFVPEPLLHNTPNGLAAYPVELHLDAAPDASFGLHGLTLYATGCAGTVAKQPLLVDVRPANSRLVAVQLRGHGSVQGSGTLANAPSTIDCPTATCLAYFDDGSQVTLEATPDSGAQFVKWEGDCSDTTSQVVVTADKDKDCTAVFAALPATGSSGVLERASVDSSGVQVSENSPFGISEHPSISRDGRYVVFSSAASDLLAGSSDTNGVADVFLRDTCRTTGGIVPACVTSTSRISVTSTGAQADQASVNPVISGNGQYVAFSSRASLTSDDTTTGTYDIYRYTRQTGGVKLINITPTGQFGNYNFAVGLAISPDGRFVAWSDSTQVKIFIKDVDTNTLYDVATPPNFNSSSSLWPPAMSDNGSVIAFASTHPYVASDTNTFEDVYVLTRVGSTTTSMTRITDAASNGSVRGDLGVSISGDGNLIAYVTKDQEAGNPVDTNNALDVYVYNRQTQTKTLVSVGIDSNGSPAPSSSSNQFGVDSANPFVSADGSSVGFDSTAENLVTGINNIAGMRNVFVRTLAGNQTRQPSVSPCGVGSNQASWFPALSEDGSLLAFASTASNFVQGTGTNCDGDTNFRRDVFVAR